MTEAIPAITASAPQPASKSEAKLAKPGLLGGLYKAVIRLAESPRAEPWLFLISFAESSFFPIPPDAMLAPMCFARPDRAYRYAIVCTIASVLGAMLGYAIGYLVFESVGQAILNFFGYGGKEQALRDSYAHYGVWIIFLKGLTPIPFKLVTIISGAMKFNFPIFLAACILTRGLRFGLEGFIFKTFGPALAPVIEKRVGLFMLAFAVILVGGFIAVALIH